MSSTAASRTGERPASATHFPLYLFALASVLGTIAYLRHAGFTTPQNVAIVMLSAAIPIAIVDVFILRAHRRPSTGLDWDRPAEWSVARTLTKVVGLGVTLGAIVFAFWLFPEYRPARDDSSFYQPLYAAVRHLGIPFAIVAPIYFFVVDARMVQPRDAYWQLGRMALGHVEDLRGADVAAHARGWLVKAFFVPLMVTYLHRQLSGVLGATIESPTLTSLRLYDFGYDLMFVLDLVFTVVGYVASLRILDTHLRSAEPTMLGWCVAVACYMPFYSLIGRQYLAYDVGPSFGAFFADYPVVRWCWAIAILFLLSIYVSATVTFGLRFSNLTSRGILTGGPYRFTKHPAYVSKNLSWWILSMPFASRAGVEDAVRGSLLLLGLNTIYFLRARTEERHLSHDPAYVEYALWMNEHSLFAGLAKRLPFLKYTPPQRAADA
jgi:protein-S-isoprenylcysteine O-methyltransferase Ste14